MKASIDAVTWPMGAEDFGPCPHCPGKLGVLRSGPEGDVIASLHTEPRCSAFHETDANAFLLNVLDIREAARRGAAES